MVAITSGKGGVGKSSVTTNLAVALAGPVARLACSTPMWGFSIPRMLGITHPPVVIEESILPPAAHGVRAVSMDYFVGDDQAVIWRGPMLHKAIQQFLEDVFWDDPEFLLVDMPPGTGDVAISMSQFLPRAQVIVVTTPQPTAQRVARRRRWPRRSTRRSSGWWRTCRGSPVRTALGTRYSARRRRRPG